MVKEEDTPPATPEGLGISEETEPKISTAEEFNTVYPLSGPPSRTQSQLQVRDLQDQMKGLHIKISTLKVRAQEDGLRRRSLQSLRTPSPLASSNNWYDNDMAYKDVRNMNNMARDEPAQDDHNDNPTSEDRHETQEPVAGEREKKEDVTSVATEIDDDSQSVMESLYEDAEDRAQNDAGSEIDRDELNQILNEPLDEEFDETLEAFPPVPNNHESTPHEEREDAFDYEHFILHSALGNYAQTLRRPSNSSIGSVETTRPVYDRPGRISRSNSVTSQSTMASFATATEGERDDLESVLYWDRKFNDGRLIEGMNEERSLTRAELRNHDHYDSDGSDGRATPRGRSRQARNGHNSHHHTPSSASAGTATPTALVSSLVSTVQAASSPHPGAEKSGMNNDDTRMLEQLFQSLGDVCMDLQALTTQPEPDEKSVRVLRRRLDAARRVLDGELDT